MSALTIIVFIQKPSKCIRINKIVTPNVEGWCIRRTRDYNTVVFKLIDFYGQGTINKFGHFQMQYVLL